MIIYTVNLLDELKRAGYSTYKLRKDRLLSESTIQKLRNGDMITLETLDSICALLDYQPGEILEYVPDDEVIKDERL